MKRAAGCHSGLSGIFLCFQNDSRRASLAGMTAFKVFNCQSNNMFDYSRTIPLPGFNILNGMDRKDLSGGSIRNWQGLKTLPIPFRRTKGKVNSSPQN